MSEIYRAGSSRDVGRNAVYGGVFIDAVEDSLSRVQKILAGISGGWQQAVGSAISRAANAGKTEVKRAVTEEYTISQSTFLQNTKNINHYQRDSGGEVSVVFGYAGYVLPLLKFNTRYGNDGKIRTQVKRSSAVEALEHAFAAHMGSHTGIYERIGPTRFPVKELFGPATPQMIYSNEAVLDKAEERMVAEYDKRIEHEINRLLNGWGG